MTATPLRAVILGAGRPARGQLPAALFDLAGGGRVLDWQIAALRPCCAELVFVGGYRFPEVIALYPDLQAVINPRWDSTGATGSLLRALPAAGQGCVVGYADTLFRADLVRRLVEHPAHNVIAIDSCWRRRYDNRAPGDAAAAEVLQSRGGLLLRAWGRGSLPHPDDAQAEYAGLARLGPAALACLRQLSVRPDCAGWDLPSLFNALLEAGQSIAVIDCQGDWAELNAPQDIARFVLGTKAETLERLRPMVRASRIGRSVSFSVGEWRADPGAWLQQVAATLGHGRLVVRSSALGEDGFAASGAGRFDSVLDVAGGDANAVTAAIGRVIQSFGDGQLEHQLLLQCQITDIALAGVVMTRTLGMGAPYRVVNFDATSGRSDGVTSGRGESLRTVYLHHDETALPGGLPPGLAALLVAVREIERLVCHDSLDIEFIVDAEGSVHVLQIRPIAVDHGGWRGSDALVRAALDGARSDFERLQAPAPFVLGRRAPFSVMSDWNPAEMIGTRPRRLAFSLYAGLITDAVWARQRAEYGYRSVAPQPLMQAFAGQPYIDVRASLNSFVPADLDDALASRLVDHALDRLAAEPHLHDKIEFEIAFSCLTLDFAARADALRRAGFDVAEVERLRTSLVALTRHAVARVGQDGAAIERLAARRQALAADTHAPLRRALWLLDDCREHGTLPFAHLARSAFVATALLRSAVARGLVSGDEHDAYLQSIHSVATEYRRDFARLQAGEWSREQFLASYGHLRPGTYEITVPCYAQAAELYLGGAGAEPPERERAPVPPGLASIGPRLAQALAALGLEIDGATLDHFMRQAIAGRERAKFLFTQSLSAALEGIAGFGERIGLDRESLSHLSLADLRAVDAGLLFGDVATTLRARAEEGRLAHEVSLGVELPPLLLDRLDFTAFVHPAAEPNFVGQGRVTAPLVCIDGRAGAAGKLAGAIVLARQADPGHDWLFAQGIAGLVTAFGGANSHMAVRAAELGLPAAIGVGEQRYRQLATASRLLLDSRHRLLRVPA